MFHVKHTDNRGFSKIGDWDFDDGFGPAEELQEKEPAIESRVVVLKHMFTQKELKDDPTLLLDLKEDVREEAETMGDVTNVVLYDVSWVQFLFFTYIEFITGGARWYYDCEVPRPYQCKGLYSGEFPDNPAG